MVNESWEFPLDWYKTNVMSSVELVEKTATDTLLGAATSLAVKVAYTK